MVSFTKLATAALLASSAMALPHGHGHNHVEKRSTSKRGAAYNDASAVQTLASGNSVISWAYDWNMFTDGLLPSGIEYVPMLWGGKMFGGWLVAIETALASGAQHIMGFNEPDNASQANMSPSDAANYYTQYITPYSGQAKLVSPAVTSSGSANEGLSWMSSFLSECTNCGISVMAVHWYGDSAADLQSFVTQAVQVANQYGLQEVWLSEFGLTSDINSGASSSASVEFLNEVLPWLDSQSGVTRYAYFYAAENYMLSGSGLTQTGLTYVA